MVFTYQPDVAAPDALTLVRMEVGDIYDVTVPSNKGRGVKPFGDNFTDGEVLQALLREGGVAPFTEPDIMRAAARLMEQLARAWTRLAASQSVAARSTSYNQSQQYAARAAELRTDWGWAEANSSTGGGAEVNYMVRVDDSIIHSTGELG